MANPSTLGGQSYGRLGLPSILATRKVRENTKKEEKSIFIYRGSAKN